MNDMRMVLRFLYDNPWATFEDIMDGTNLKRRVLSGMIKKDLNLRSKEDFVEGHKQESYCKRYALPSPKGPGNEVQNEPVDRN